MQIDTEFRTAMQNVLAAAFIVLSGYGFTASALLFAHPAQAQDLALPRVASINMCTDQLALLLAERNQLLSVSLLSHDKAGSYLYESARIYPSNTGNSEEILQLKPDVVLAGQYTTRYTIKLLKELGIEVVTVPIANNVDDLVSNVRLVADAIGQSDKGDRLINDMKSRLLAIKVRYDARKGADPTALYLDPNAYTVGAATIRGQVLSLAGWANMADSVGITHYGSLPLETLVTALPDMLIDSPYSEGTYSRGQYLLNHRALREGGTSPEIMHVPSRQTICAGPWTIDLIEQMQQRRADMVEPAQI